MFSANLASELCVNSMRHNNENDNMHDKVHDNVHEKTFSVTMWLVQRQTYETENVENLSVKVVMKLDSINVKQDPYIQ